MFRMEKERNSNNEAEKMEKMLFVLAPYVWCVHANDGNAQERCNNNKTAHNSDTATNLSVGLLPSSVCSDQRNEMNIRHEETF